MRDFYIEENLENINKPLFLNGFEHLYNTDIYLQWIDEEAPKEEKLREHYAEERKLKQWLPTA